MVFTTCTAGSNNQCYLQAFDHGAFKCTACTSQSEFSVQYQLSATALETQNYRGLCKSRAKEDCCPMKKFFGSNLGCEGEDTHALKAGAQAPLAELATTSTGCKLSGTMDSNALPVF